MDGLENGEFLLGTYRHKKNTCLTTNIFYLKSNTMKNLMQR
jgi:hypothetical protein